MVERVLDPEFPNLVVSVSSDNILWSMVRPAEMLESGDFMELEELRGVATDLGFTDGAATRAHRNLAINLSEGDDPFSLLYDVKPWRPKTHGICTTYGFVGVFLDQFYLRTGGVRDHYEAAVRPNPQASGYGKACRAIIEAALY
jgi:hypothetical protein